MNRRSSHTPAPTKRLTSKRVSLKDNTLSVPSHNRHSLGDIREGDTYYKTVHSCPAISDVPEITLSIARVGSHRIGSATNESRRGSIYSESRAVSPLPGAGSAMSGRESPSIGDFHSSRYHLF